MPEVFRFTENRESRRSTLTEPSEIRVYSASGNSNKDFVLSYALGASPAFISHPAGTIYRQDVQVDPVGFKIWTVKVPYGPRKRENGEYTIDFDTTGGTVHITNSRQTIQKYTAPGQPAAPDMGGAIGVRGDQIDGTEIVIPALKITVDFKHPAGMITLSQIKNFARWTGRYNTGEFLTFASGEVLFLGSRGREGTNTDTTIQYQFAMSENVDGQNIGAILNTAKKGWEYGWISYQDRADGGVPHKRPRWYYVERVYEGIDLAAALGFGG